MVVVMILAALIGIVIGIVIARSITGPLQKGVEMMKEMAKGHLGTRLKMERKDEIGELAGAMDVFSEDLQVKSSPACRRSPRATSAAKSRPRMARTRSPRP